jgi:hypothetical protein
VVIQRHATGEVIPLTKGEADMFKDTPIADAANKASTKIYYPTGKKDDYQAADGWKTYKDTTTWIEGTP